MASKTSAGSGASKDEPLSRGRRAAPVGNGVAATGVRADYRAVPDPMREMRTRALLVHLRGPLDYDGRLRLNRQTFETLSRLGLNRTWISQAANRLVKDGLAGAHIEDGIVTLRITEAGRDASW